MADFNRAIQIILAHEGGYAYVEGDQGGETYRGVSRKWNPDWEGWALVDMHKPLVHRQIIEDLTLEEMLATFYYKRYWVPVMGDKIVSQRVANILADWYVTSGDDAVKALQVIAKVKADGHMGPVSLAAINKICQVNEAAVIACFNVVRKGFYTVLAKRGENAKFLKGWLARVDSVC